MLLLVAAIGFGTLVLSHIAPFPFLLDAFRPDRSLWHMETNPSGPAVYLTFDDGPNPDATPMLLDVLQREGATATFFLRSTPTSQTTPHPSFAGCFRRTTRWRFIRVRDG